MPTEIRTCTLILFHNHLYLQIKYAHAYQNKKAASVRASLFSLLMITSKLLLLRRRPTNLFADRIYDTGLLLHVSSTRAVHSSCS
jgi:hypothetical protein